MFDERGFFFMRNAFFLWIFLVFANNAAAAEKSTLIMKTDILCQLSINGEDRGVLKPDAAQRLQLAPGKQAISCVADARRVERIANVQARSSLTIQLVFPPRERFERVADGIKDNAQNLIWVSADNGGNIGWADAKQHCAAMGKGWKLPSGAALQSLYDESGKNEQTLDFNGTNYVLKLATPLIKFTGGGFWSDEQNEYGVWGVNLSNGTRYTFRFDAINFTRAICVRLP